MEERRGRFTLVSRREKAASKTIPRTRRMYVYGVVQPTTPA